ncbi:hypothetical protein [Bacillus cereus]|nr:hypothetical protein [Bacillus cereus]MDA2208480.1 hypothetical protein [Bacillus cereus]
MLQNLLKVFLGIIVIGYGNKLVNNISKAQKNLPTPSEAKGKF